MFDVIRLSLNQFTIFQNSLIQARIVFQFIRFYADDIGNYLLVNPIKIVYLTNICSSFSCYIGNSNDTVCNHITVFYAKHIK